MQRYRWRAGSVNKLEQFKDLKNNGIALKFRIKGELFFVSLNFILQQSLSWLFEPKSIEECAVK